MVRVFKHSPCQRLHANILIHSSRLIRGIEEFSKAAGMTAGTDVEGQSECRWRLVRNHFRWRNGVVFQLHDGKFGIAVVITLTSDSHLHATGPLRWMHKSLPRSIPRLFCGVVPVSHA